MPTLNHPVRKRIRPRPRHRREEKEIDGSNGTTTVRIYSKDHLGSVRGWLTVSNGTASPGGTLDYDAWGNGGSTPAGVGYTGHFKHATSGLLLAPFRATEQ
jgi:hypothetical protein